MKVLVKKSFKFVEEIWESYVQQTSGTHFVFNNLDTLYPYFCYIMCSEIVGDVQPEQSDEPVDENEDLVNDSVHLLAEDLDEDA